MRSIALAVAAASALCLASPVRAADDYPAKPITLVVAYSPGGAVDAVARLIGQHLAENVGKPVVVDNRSGASGNIGAQYVARSAPDGYTLLLAPLTSYAMNGALFPGVAGYQLDKDFAPIELVGYLPLVLVVNNAVPATSVAQLVALAKAKPDAFNFGSSGNGSIEHVAGEMFNRQAGLALRHIPYRGAAPAMTDLMSGQLQIMFATTPTVMANLKTGLIRPLMVASPQRLAALPDVPTAAEAGLRGFEVASTYALLAPAGTPAAIVHRLNDEVGRIMRMPDVTARFRALSIEPQSSTPEEAARRVGDEVSKWTKAIRDAGIKAEK